MSLLAIATNNGLRKAVRTGVSEAYRSLSVLLRVSPLEHFSHTAVMGCGARPECTHL